jgi:hypothetical protein
LRRRRKYLEDGYNCVICLEDVEESVEHLFFDCQFAACRWFALGITWNAHLNIHQKIQTAKLDFAQPFFMEIFMIGAWCIWNKEMTSFLMGSLHAWLHENRPSKLKSQNISLGSKQVFILPSCSGCKPCNCLLSSVLLVFFGLLVFWPFGLFLRSLFA